jgi:hypothetical protein
MAILLLSSAVSLTRRPPTKIDVLNGHMVKQVANLSGLLAPA